MKGTPLSIVPFFFEGYPLFGGSQFFWESQGENQSPPIFRRQPPEIIFLKALPPDTVCQAGPGCWLATWRGVGGVGGWFASPVFSSDEKRASVFFGRSSLKGTLPKKRGEKVTTGQLGFPRLPWVQIPDPHSHVEVGDGNPERAAMQSCCMLAILDK